jgi:heme-degrading monooxygenase HmoA
MYVSVWEFEVREEVLAEFMADYGPEGSWVRLFRRSPDYLGFHLLCDRNRPDRFVTVDQWTSREAYLTWRDAHRPEHDALDLQGAQWTRAERSLGEFEAVGPA